MTVAAPHSPDAEGSVVGHLLNDPSRVGEVVGTLLEPKHFYVPACKVLYDEIVTAYYADEAIDALSIAENCSKTLARSWSIDEHQAVAQVRAIVASTLDGDPVDHAKIVKRDCDYRELLKLATTIESSVSSEMDSPDEIAASTSTTAMQIATSTLITQEIISFADLGRSFIANQQRLMAARAQGIELGAYFGMDFIDNWIRGLQPTELWIMAGEPGSGKSATAWRAATNFAIRQSKKDPKDQIGALILSLEMGQDPSEVRVGQSITGLDGGMLREGKTTQDDLNLIIKEWGQLQDIPLYFNHASMLNSSQLRAMIVEAVRRHNVGVVIIDHMRYVNMDGNFANRNEEDEEKARFFKQRIAKDLNVAVIVLAHTTKGIDNREDRRPKLTDLRGSGQIAAEADFVSFVYRPYMHASEEAISEGRVKRTDAEMLYEKNRHGLTGPARYYFDPSKMEVS